MRVPVLTALPGAPWEADLVARLGREDHGVTVVRRCADIPELLSTAASGVARAALVSVDLRRLDRDTIGRLASAGVAAVGLVHPGDAGAEQRLRGLGVHRIVAADAGAEAVARAVMQAVSDGLVADDASTGDPAAALPLLRPASPAPPPPRGRGRVVAVWGPAGAPGRTTVAIGLADETARLGVSTLLADADVYGGTVAQTLGLLDETAGLVVAADAAGARPLGCGRPRQLCRQLTPTLRVLTGPVRADRWPELRPRGMLAVLDAGTAPVARDGRRLRLLPGAGRGARVRHRGSSAERRHPGRARGRGHRGLRRQRRPGGPAPAGPRAGRAARGGARRAAAGRGRTGCVHGRPGEPRREIDAALQPLGGRLGGRATCPPRRRSLDTAMPRRPHARRGSAGQPAAARRRGPCPDPRRGPRRRPVGRRRLLPARRLADGAPTSPDPRRVDLRRGGELRGLLVDYGGVLTTRSRRRRRSG